MSLADMYVLLDFDWLVSKEGDDYCKECWEKYVRESEDNIVGSSFTSDHVHTRRVDDGWMVICKDCGKKVFEPLWDLTNTKIWISTPDDVHDKYGICIYSKDNENVVKYFECLCREYFMDNTHPEFPTEFFKAILQAGHRSTDWRYFEFWTSHFSSEMAPKDLLEKASLVQDKILEFGEMIAKWLGFDGICLGDPDQEEAAVTVSES